MSFWQFHDVFMGNFGGDALRRFWTHVQEQEPWKDHAGLRKLSDAELEMTIPFCAHADGAELFTDHEYFCWSWTAAFRTGSMCKDVLMTRIPVLVVSEFQMLDDRASSLNISKQNFQCKLGL